VEAAARERRPMVLSTVRNFATVSSKIRSHRRHPGSGLSAAKGCQKLIMRRLAILFLVASGLAARGADPALADKRVALVIGNSGYKNTTQLKNPSNDASDIADVLARVGFEVIRGIDLDYLGMRDRARIFAEKLAGADVGLFFYAGHGLQVFGKNFLVPVDARLSSTSDLDFGTIDLDLILRNMERETRTNIVFLDACRDNPFAQNLARSMGTRSEAMTRGLAQVESGVGTLIAFATQPGNVALDGEGRNSPFTGALLKTIEQPGLPLGEVMIAVRNAVLKQTDSKQVPWEHSSLTGQFYFVPPPPVSAPAAAAPPPPPPEQPNFEIVFWNSIKDQKNPQLFEAYLKRYPKGEFADIARINLQEQKATIQRSVVDQPDDKVAVSDPGLLRELRDRLYELNFDPGPTEGPIGEPAREAIREFEQKSSLPPSGAATQGLLRRLRELGGLKPWGAIVYARNGEKWGMAWAQDTRRVAVANARSSCGDAAGCTAEISFFGTDCAAFAHSESGWAIVARDDIRAAKEAALGDCGKRGKKCRLIASVCADGAERFQAGN
jgi:Caspase domain/Domain of unknown function (DUF4189)/Putative peptidoglycan binding domain